MVEQKIRNEARLGYSSLVVRARQQPHACRAVEASGSGGGGAGIGLTTIQDRDQPGPRTHARASWSTSSVLPTWYVLSSQVEEECARHSAASQVAVKLPPSA